MRTLKTFIELALATMLALLLTSCISLDGTDHAAKSSAPHGPSDQNAQRRANGEIISPSRRERQIVPLVSEETAADFEAAVALMRDGELSAAETLLLEITISQPELAGPWINLGLIYVALQQPEDARRAFEAALAVSPGHCTAHNELGRLSRQHGDFTAAEQHYLECLAGQPDHAPVRLNLGILYELYLGRLADALAHYRHYQALQDEPDRRVQGWVVDLERRLGV